MTAMISGFPGWNKGMKRQPDGSYAYPPKPPPRPLTCGACGAKGRYVSAPKARGRKSEVLCEACWEDSFA